MKVGRPIYFPYGPHALLISWPDEISKTMLARIRYIDHKLQSLQHVGITDIIPAYSSLLIKLRSGSNTCQELISVISDWEDDDFALDMDSLVHRIEVDYSAEAGLDIEALATAKQLSVEDVIDLHSSVTYDVHFIGFLPGFLYLGGLDARLHTERLSTPRTRVPAGAVAIGGQQTGIYPMSSPGGWHIIGHTDHTVLNIDEDPPVRITIGDQVKFIPKLCSA